MSGNLKIMHLKTPVDMGEGWGDESHPMPCCDDARKIVKFESYYYVARNC